MNKKWQQHPIFWFYLLAIYVILQFVWWGILIIRLTADKYEGQEDITSRLWMVAGEGLVFLLILALGIWHVRKSFLKELKVSRQQNNFLLSVSHELKTPLSSIKLYLQTLKSRKLEEEKSQEIIGYSLEETARLHTMIDNILTASKMEYRNFDIYNETFNLSEYVQARVDQLSAGLGSNHKTSTTIQEGINITTDQTAVTSIINNLYENAVKYSEKGTEISVGLSQDAEGIHLSVQDQGMGINKSIQEDIFNKFYREGNEEVRKTKGTGLGLYIVDQYTNMTNGIKTITSPLSEQGGSLFKITWKA